MSLLIADFYFTDRGCFIDFLEILGAKIEGTPGD